MLFVGVTKMYRGVTFPPGHSVHKLYICKAENYEYRTTHLCIELCAVLQTVILNLLNMLFNVVYRCHFCLFHGKFRVVHFMMSLMTNLLVLALDLYGFRNKRTHFKPVFLILIRVFK